jgi:hypothetical protein
VIHELANRHSTRLHDCKHALSFVLMFALVFGLQLMHSDISEASSEASSSVSVSGDHSAHGDGPLHGQPSQDDCSQPACGACLAFVDAISEPVVLPRHEVAVVVSDDVPRNGTTPPYRPPTRSI